MSESFAELFEQSLVQSEMRQGSILRGTVVDIGNDVVVVNAGLKSEGLIPKWQFLSDSGEIEVRSAMKWMWPWKCWKTAWALRCCPATRPRSKWPGANWRKLSKKTPPWSAASAAKCAAVSPFPSARCARSCPAPWWTCVRCAIPRSWKTATWNSRSSRSTRSATTWCCRAVPWWKKNTARNARPWWTA